jgi:nucleoside-diphosphate-sugar epimerase
MPTAPLHVVFGAGQVGPLLARRLASRGYAVRLVRRGAHEGGHIAGVEPGRADATDRAAVDEAVRGAAVVYHCMNPRAYSAEAWGRELPVVQERLVAAAGRVSARLVVLDNLYALGRTGGRPMNEETPPNPCSRKGEIRARLHEALLAAARRGDVRVAVGRASDFYGPGGVGTYFADRFWKPALAGRKVGFPANPDTPHTYHFIPDVAAGLAALGEDPGADGTFMLPCLPAVTSRAMADRFAAALGRPIALSRLPPFALALVGLFVPIVRELGEMAYQWDEPFVVDDARFRARFGDLVTPAEIAARETHAWAVATWGAGARTAA